MKVKRPALATVDLNMLRALDALLDSASVAVAAKRLGITPAAASNALRRLRDHFGDALLVRSGSHMSRTPLGERLRERAATGMRAATEALVVEPRFDPSVASGELRVATSDHVDMVWLEPLRARLAHEAPNVEVQLLPYSSEAPAQALRGEIDLVIAPAARFPEALRAVHLADEPYAVVLRGAHPHARGRLDVDVLAALSHLVVSPIGDSAGTPVDRALAALGRRRRVLRRVTSFSSALLVLATTDLVGVLPRSFAALHATRLDLRVREVPIRMAPTKLGMAWSARLHDDPLHTFVRRHLAALARARSGRVER